jgi:hypothetical protein
MIVLLDIKNQQILLYSKDGLEKIPFCQAHTIVEYIGNEKVTYVTHGMEAHAEDIANVVSSLGIQVPSVNDLPIHKYLHGTTDNRIYINENLKFNGRYDCKLIDDEMNKIIQSEPILLKLIEKNKIEIIGEVRKRKLQNELEEIRSKKEALKQKEEDRIGEIIMDKPVSEWDGKIHEDKEDHEGIIEIDLTSDIKSGKAETMSDLLEQIEGN